jgi:hypothetical protein
MGVSPRTGDTQSTRYPGLGRTGWSGEGTTTRGSYDNYRQKRGYGEGRGAGLSTWPERSVSVFRGFWRCLVCPRSVSFLRLPSGPALAVVTGLGDGTAGGRMPTQDWTRK